MRNLTSSQGAVVDLDSSPDRQLDVAEGDFELVEAWAELEVNLPDFVLLPQTLEPTLLDSSVFTHVQFLFFSWHGCFLLRRGRQGSRTRPENKTVLVFLSRMKKRKG